jgi:hypothetical protein
MHIGHTIPSFPTTLDVFLVTIFFGYSYHICGHVFLVQIFELNNFLILSPVDSN